VQCEFHVSISTICHSGESRNLFNVDGIPAFAGMMKKKDKALPGMKTVMPFPGQASSEGLRERSLRENAGRGGPAVDANCAHAFAAIFASGKILQSPGSHGV
jgi:hypothetical protein